AAGGVFDDPVEAGAIAYRSIVKERHHQCVTSVGRGQPTASQRCFVFRNQPARVVEVVPDGCQLPNQLGVVGQLTYPALLEAIPQSGPCLIALAEILVWQGRLARSIELSELYSKR